MFLILKVPSMGKALRKEIEIMEIGRCLGFGSHSHFSSVFRKLVGKSPREYRKMAVEQPAKPASPREQGAVMVSRLTV